MHTIHNSQVADIFDDIADMLDLLGENRFRVLAYRKAALVVSDLPEELKKMVADGDDLTKLPGIGKDLAAKISEIVGTGSCEMYKKLQKKVPLSLVQLVHLRDMGPKKVQKLNQKLKIKNIDDLERVAKAGKISLLEGFGEKSEEKILESIALFRSGAGRMKLSDAQPIADSIADFVKRIKGVKRVEVAGSFRRRQESVGDLDILITGVGGASVLKEVSRFEDVKKVIASGETKVTLRLYNNLQVDVRFVKPESFGAALNYFTGSKEHNVALRGIAKRMGLKLSEYGIFKGSKRVAGKNEEEVYRKLGLKYVEPELRENRGEIEASREGRLPRLITLKDIKGDLHMHTVASDGADSIVDMAMAAKKLGYEYIAITDHSGGQRQANGLDAKRLKKHLKDIEAADKRVSGIKIFSGTEVDILKDGSLDYKDDILREIDFVVASVHGNFNLSSAEQTKRVVRAIKSGNINAVGHLTTRLIGDRKPVECNVEEILKAARDYNVVMELNSEPSRLDLNDVHCKLAKEHRVKIVISTDSHSVSMLSFIRYGVDTARRGWIEKGDVLNTLPLSKFKAAIRR